MGAPFMLFEGGDLCLFRSVSELAAYVESPDIDEYLAVDSSGRVIRLVARETKPASKSGVRLTPVSTVIAIETTDIMEPTALHSRLATALKRSGVAFETTASVAELLRAAEVHIGYSL